MSHTLLMRLIAPMQSWGVQSDFTNRDTGLEPSKSGVIGLLCAALGKPRDETHPDNQDKPSLVELASLRMGVRVDREGLLKRDYHTAKDVRVASGTKMTDTKTTELSERFYLADAAFLIGLEGEDSDLLHKLDNALHRSRWSLFLGRKSFVPSEPVWIIDGVRENTSLEDALRDLHLHPRLRTKRKYDDERMRFVIENNTGSIVRTDQPISFSRSGRKFAPRRVSVTFYNAPEPMKEAA